MQEEAEEVDKVKTLCGVAARMQRRALVFAHTLQTKLFILYRPPGCSR